VSAQPSAQLADLNGVRQSLAQICASCDEFDRFFSGVFDGLEDLAGELLRRQREWVCERNESKNEMGREKRELAEVRLQIERQRYQIQSEQATAEQHSADEKLGEELRRVQKQRDELVHEQQLLEAELDTVRNRAAEMAEQLTEQQNQLAAERAQWTEELKRMRHVIETLVRQQVERAASQPTAPAAVRPHDTSRGPQDPPGAADPVLGSVVAQFEMLQKEVAGRRKRVAGATSPSQEHSAPAARNRD